MHQQSLTVRFHAPQAVPQTNIVCLREEEKIGLVASPKSFHKHNDFEEPIVSEPPATYFRASHSLQQLWTELQRLPACHSSTCSCSETEITSPIREVIVLMNSVLTQYLDTIRGFMSHCIHVSWQRLSVQLPLKTKQKPLQAKICCKLDIQTTTSLDTACCS